jgi:hypothetical protein
VVIYWKKVNLCCIIENGTVVVAFVVDIDVADHDITVVVSGSEAIIVHSVVVVAICVDIVLIHGLEMISVASLMVRYGKSQPRSFRQKMELLLILLLLVVRVVVMLMLLLLLLLLMLLFIMSLLLLLLLLL